ncbi:CHC2 zinc finger domain-containing protein [Salmonella sp. WGH-01]|nr:CHC2 zinc finger domain-containing protein [Salmonella sp. WGH-01]
MTCIKGHMAGRIPRVFINDLLARTDIVDLIDVRVKLKKQGKNYHACCPFHNEKPLLSP